MLDELTTNWYARGPHVVGVEEWPAEAVEGVSRDAGVADGAALGTVDHHVVLGALRVYLGHLTGKKEKKFCDKQRRTQLTMDSQYVSNKYVYTIYCIKLISAD